MQKKNMFFEIHKELYDVYPFVLTSIGSNRQQDAVSRPRGFNSHHFLWIEEGVGHFCVDGKTFDLHAGEGIFLRDHVPHSYHGADFHTAWFTFTMTKEMLDHIGLPDFMRFEVPAFLDREFRQLFRFSTSSSTMLTRSAAGYTLFCELASAILSPKDSVAVRIEQLLECRYAEPLTLDVIAASVGMDRFSLCHYFAAETGKTVMDRLLHIRIEKAKRFLKYSNDPIKKIGEMCGFESSSYFGKRFRETVGCTPSEYRKRNNESVFQG